jgi:hypothetical protein
MIKYILPAAVAAIALAAPAVVHAQMPQPLQPPMAIGNTTAVNAPGAMQPDGSGQGYTETESQTTYSVGPAYGAPPPDAAPMPGALAPAVSPRTTWIPGHYNWDPNTSNYVWTGGQYTEAPTATAQWVPGHWAQTLTSWIWIQGGWQ